MASTQDVVHEPFSKDSDSVECPTLPSLMKKERIRVVGVVHPFYCNTLSQSKPHQGIITSSRGAIYKGTDYGRAMEDEQRVTDKSLEILKRESKYADSMLLLVGYTVPEAQYRTLTQNQESGLLCLHPSELYQDGEKEEMIGQVLKMRGFQGSYDELWYIQNALKSFGADRTIYFENAVDQDRLYAMFGVGERDLK